MSEGITPNGRKVLQVLLVDDEEEQHFIFSQACKQLEVPINVVQLTNPTLLIDTLSKSQFDIVFMDFHMPLLSAEDCLRELKKHSELKPVPVVVLAGGDNPNEKKKSLELGAKYYLEKPSSIKALAQMLQLVLVPVYNEITRKRP